MAFRKDKAVDISGGVARLEIYRCCQARWHVDERHQKPINEQQADRYYCLLFRVSVKKNDRCDEIAYSDPLQNTHNADRTRVDPFVFREIIERKRIEKNADQE